MKIKIIWCQFMVWYYGKLSKIFKKLADLAIKERETNE